MNRFLKLMPLIAVVLFASLTTRAQSSDPKEKTNPNTERYNVSANDGTMPFGKSYYELDGKPSGASGNFYDSAHPDWGMKQWPDKNAQKHVVTYLHFPACTSDMQIQLTTTGNVTFNVVVTCMENNTQISSKTVSINKGTSQWITVMDSKQLPLDAWYKVDIECTAGVNYVGQFFYWKFNKTGSNERVYTADYMSSPSVHLNAWRTTDPTVPSAGRYDWAYQEVMVPEGDDKVGTYCMSLGVLHGYMGIQVDSEQDYPIIFSMWDNGSTDQDKNLPEYLRSGALDWSEGVTIARFGGEGTGAQAKFRTKKNWVPGKWVKFLTNARPEIVDVEIDDPDHPGQKKIITYTNTLCSSWVWADGIDTDWRYIATIRQSGANNYFDGWYSFLEDYNWPSGQWARRAFYRGGGLHSMVNGKWYHANQVGFGHTDGGNKYGDRNDYGHGVSTEYPGAFYMYSGGYFNSPKDTENTVPLIENYNPVDQATIERLTARIDQALKREQTTKMEAEVENSRTTLASTGFTVVGNNSEATNEGDKNRATAATDGDENTYWHTRWSEGTGNTSFPYSLDIEVSEEMRQSEIEQILLYQSRGDNYRAKTVQVSYSDNKTSWTKVGDDYTIENTNRPTIQLNSTIKNHRYIRLYFKNGYGQYMVLNEVYFRTARSRETLNAQVQSLLSGANHFDGYSSNDLAPLSAAYNNGNWTDESQIRTALMNLAANGTQLKFGVVNNNNAISSFKAYQIHNVFGRGNLVVNGNTPSALDDESTNVVDNDNNWAILRSEKWDAYYLYNLGAGKFLTYADKTFSLTNKPTPVYLSTHTTNKKSGFTITFDSDGGSSNYLNAKAPVSGTTVSDIILGTATTEGALWELRDNYGITPSVPVIFELLNEVEKNGAPDDFVGDGYTIKLADSNLYLTTKQVSDISNKTFSLSTVPEYFNIVGSNGRFTIQSKKNKQYVGYPASASNHWDTNNTKTTWRIAHVDDGEITTILRPGTGTEGLGIDAPATAGKGVFSNKSSNNQWLIEYVAPSSETAISITESKGNSSELFDLQGRKIATGKAHTRGLLIRNGRKVFVQ